MTIIDGIHHLLCLTFRTNGQRLLINDQIGPVPGNINRLRIRINSFAKLFNQLTSLLIVNHMCHSGNIRHASPHARQQTDHKLFNLFGLALKKIVQRRFDQFGQRGNTIAKFFTKAFFGPEFCRVKVKYDLRPKWDVLQFDWLTLRGWLLLWTVGDFRINLVLRRRFDIRRVGFCSRIFRTIFGSNQHHGCHCQQDHSRHSQSEVSPSTILFLQFFQSCRSPFGICQLVKNCKF